MNALAHWLRPRWAWLALLASAAMLATAHAFERFGGLRPCALCLQQRDIYWGAMLFALAAVFITRVRADERRRTIAAVILGLIFLVGAATAMYHVAVEHHWVIAQCDAASMNDITTLGSGPIEVPQCDQVQWSLFGVSMAGWNLLASLGLAGLSFLAARGRA